MIFVHPRMNSTDNNQLKDALIKYGGLWVGYNAQQQAPYYNSKTAAQYYNGTERSNHAVLLVGWDDSYSKDNFLITPPGDGAFILKNSWELLLVTKDIYTFHIMILNLYEIVLQ